MLYQLPPGLHSTTKGKWTVIMLCHGRLKIFGNLSEWHGNRSLYTHTPRIQFNKNHILQITHHVPIT